MFIYVIGTDTGYQKIGISKDVNKRLSALQTGNPNKLKIHYSEEVQDDRAYLIEQQIHKEIKLHNISGEWFDITPIEAMQEVQHGVIRWAEDPSLGKFK